MHALVRRSSASISPKDRDTARSQRTSRWSLLSRSKISERPPVGGVPAPLRHGGRVAERPGGDGRGRQRRALSHGRAAVARGARPPRDRTGEALFGVIGAEEVRRLLATV